MLLNPYICHISASVDQILICLLFPPYFIVAIMGVDTRFEDLINRTLRMAKLRFKNYALFPGHPLVYQMVKRRQPAINISHSSATSTANTFDFFSWLEFLSWVSFCLRPKLLPDTTARGCTHMVPYTYKLCNLGWLNYTIVQGMTILTGNRDHLSFIRQLSNLGQLWYPTIDICCIIHNLFSDSCLIFDSCCTIDNYCIINYCFIINICCPIDICCIITFVET